MTPKPPSRLSIAADQAQELLAQKLVDIFPQLQAEKDETPETLRPAFIADRKALGHVVEVLNSAEYDPGWLLLRDKGSTHQINLDTDKATLRDYLGMIAAELQDPFVLEETRAKAWKHGKKQYEKRIADVDKVHNRLAYGMPGALKKFHVFMDEMMALVDERTRPHTQALRDGIAVLQAIVRKHKERHAEIAREGMLPENLEDFHFHRKTSDMVNGICIDGEAIPGEVPPVLAHELRHFKKEYCDHPEAGDDENMRKAKDALEEHIDAFLRNNTKMEREDYEAALRDYKLRSVADNMQSDMARRLINGAYDVAGTLGINVRVSARGK